MDFSLEVTCSFCGIVFSRSEHLKRHLVTTHSEIRPFQCTSCPRNFQRRYVTDLGMLAIKQATNNTSDALRRHQSSIHQSLSDLPTVKRPEPRSRAQQACQKCRLQKQRCDGAFPCGRCSFRNLPCTYLPFKGPRFGARDARIVQTCKALETAGTDMQKPLCSDFEELSDSITEEITCFSRSAERNDDAAFVASLSNSTTSTESVQMDQYQIGLSSATSEGDALSMDIGTETSSLALIPPIDLRYSSTLLHDDHASSPSSSPSLFANPSDVELPQEDVIVSSPLSATDMTIQPLSENAYRRVVEGLSRLLLSSRKTVPNNALIPPKEFMDLFIQLYFDSFSPLMPMLSPHSFDPEVEHWLLVFAVGVVGGTFSRDAGSLYSRSMLDTLQKCFVDLVSYIYQPPPLKP